MIKHLITLGISVSLLIAIIIWHVTRPTEIIAVHQHKDSSHILVKNFPLTNKGALMWWQKNKILLKEKYNLFGDDPEGRYYINVWNFGGGYKDPATWYPTSQDASELFCFEKMKAKANCIRKDRLMAIDNNQDGSIYFTTYNKYYVQKEGGEIVLYRY